MKVIRQNDFRDCGITCLKYIINYYHGYVPKEKLREDTFTNQHGTTAYHLVETLKKYQFDSFGQRVSFEDLKELVLPSIVHLILPNGMEHFAILYKVKKQEVILMDPAYGKRKLKKEEFESIWDNIVLVAIPKGVIPKIPKEKSVLITLLEFLKKEYKLFLSILLFSFVISILTVINSFYLKIGLENVGIFQKKMFYQYVFCFLTFLFLKVLLDYGRNYFKIVLSKNVELCYMSEFLFHLFKLPTQKFQSYHEGEILTRINEAKEIKELFESICVTFCLDLLLGILSIAILFFIDLSLSRIILFGMIGYGIISFVFSKPFYHLVLKNMENERKWNENLLEQIRMFLTTKHLNQTFFSLKKIEDNLCSTTRKRFSYIRVASIFQYVRQNYLEIFFFLVTTYGMYLVLISKLTILDFLTFQNLYIYFVTPLKELNDIIPKFYYMKGILSKISETMNLEEEELEVCKAIKPFDIEIRDLTYSYNQIHNVFQNVNIFIHAKEHIFLDGMSGTGKSTICKILHRELVEYQGSILYDLKNLKDYKLATIRASVIYLSQNESLMAGTIKENILFGSTDEDRFFQVCEICEIDSIVDKKPFRYETSINDEALSGGERQRIMLARALMKEGSLYIFDEVLSEIEENLEIKIIKKLRRFLKNKTVIYISHKNHSKEFERRICLGKLSE